MIEARKSHWFEEIFAVYCRNLFWRRFHALQISGVENLAKRDKSVPLLLYANHSSWWDALIAFEVSRRAALDQFAMMEEKHLRQLFLFRRIGAFSVLRENPRQAIRSINYAVDLLTKKPNRALWIFPQGAIQPNDVRPLEFYSGAARIVQKLGKCFAAPVAMRYEFLNDFKPEVIARVGDLEFFERPANAKVLTAHFAAKTACLLDELKTEIQEK